MNEKCVGAQHDARSNGFGARSTRFIRPKHDEWRRTTPTLRLPGRCTIRK